MGQDRFRAQGRGVAIGLNLVPFARIAFQWFVGVLRDRIGEPEDHRLRRRRRLPGQWR